MHAAADAGMHSVVAIASPDNRAVVGLLRACLPGVRVQLRDGTVLAQRCPARGVGGGCVSRVDAALWEHDRVERAGVSAAHRG